MGERFWISGAEVRRMFDIELNHLKRKLQGLSVKFAIIEVERLKQLLEKRLSGETKK